MRLPTFYEQNLIPNWGIFLHRIYKMQNQEVCNLMYSLPDCDYSLDELT